MYRRNNKWCNAIILPKFSQNFAKRKIMEIEPGTFHPTNKHNIYTQPIDNRTTDFVFVLSTKIDIMTKHLFPVKKLKCSHQF